MIAAPRINSMLFKFENLFLIHLAWGPIAIKNKKAITTGIITELQKGGPTEILLFEIASVNIGYKVPNNTVIK